jgi:hypothetical protein
MVLGVSVHGWWVGSIAFWSVGKQIIMIECMVELSCYLIAAGEQRKKEEKAGSHNPHQGNCPKT